jgi:hypothetical protein
VFNPLRVCGRRLRVEAEQPALDVDACLAVSLELGLKTPRPVAGRGALSFARYGSSRRALTCVDRSADDGTCRFAPPGHTVGAAR